jgi:hypothetical protein
VELVPVVPVVDTAVVPPVELLPVPSGALVALEPVPPPLGPNPVRLPVDEAEPTVMGALTEWREGQPTSPRAAAATAH